MFRSRILSEMETLDPVRDHQRMVFLTCRQDFPWDTTRALEFALFRTFCVPSISALLDQTREFACRAQKRYDDTDLIISEILEHGYESERGMRAIRRMNGIHGRFNIRNVDYLYVLSTFVFEPIRWTDRFGWRRMTDKERLALFHFWREVGLRMGIRDIPGLMADFERFNVDYEAKHFHFTEASRRVGMATRNLFMNWFPRFCRPLVQRVIYGMLDDSMLRAFGFPRPPAWFKRMIEILMKLRARVLRCWPRRNRPCLRTAMRHASYPDGYTIETLGPLDNRSAPR